jgi:NADH:ubiquinone oxidoreductase subunit 2 (subunit N)
MLLAILPELLLLVLALLLFIVEPFWKGERPRSGWVTFYGLLLIMIVSLIFGTPRASQEAFGGMIRFDWFAFLFKMLFLFGAALTALFFMDHPLLSKRGGSLSAAPGGDAGDVFNGLRQRSGHALPGD